MTQPDVSVIVAVYNTMPYLTNTLASLARQTIGLDRLQVVLVDDGSDDGSEHEVDRFAAAHPGTVSVVHQPNSGTPSVPFNRGLDVSTGRYVFFLGADDYLGDEALERLVRSADDWDSDVVFGVHEGVNGRIVPTRVYRGGTVRDLDLYSSRLPYALSNTKLYCRSLIEEVGLRYREDMRQRCDQPFTLTAIVKGRRTSVLTDYVYYYSVRRDDETNVTYTADYSEYLHSTRVVMDTIAELIEPGEQRDFVMRRQFDYTLVKMLDRDLLAADASTLQRVIASVAGLAEDYLNDDILKVVNVRERLSLLLAVRGDVGGLGEPLDAVEEFRQGGPAQFLWEGGRLFQRYQGFRTGNLPDEAYEIRRESVTGRLKRGFRTQRVEWIRGRGLVLDATIAIDGLESRAVSAALVPAAGGVQSSKARQRVDPAAGPTLEVRVAPAAAGSGTDVSVVIDPVLLTQDTAWSVQLRVALLKHVYVLPFELGESGPWARTRFSGGRRHRVTADVDGDGRLVLTRHRGARGAE